LEAPVTLTLSPTLCAMLQDTLLQQRCARRIAALLELAGKEIGRTRGNPPLNDVAHFYRTRLERVEKVYQERRGDLVGAFAELQKRGRVEIMTSAATHAVLPLMEKHPASVRGQILVARDHYRSCFGREPRGIWLPECAYSEGVEPALKEAGLCWFVTDAHGIAQARPSPSWGVLAPIQTPSGLTVFGRDRETARQVWSREEGYPGDARYRDFYRDIGFDLDSDYVGPYLPAPGQRGFTGLKYHRITDRSAHKHVYERAPAMEAVKEHAHDFLRARIAQVAQATSMDRPPLIVSPYDAELFGHWWYEGPEFLDALVRMVCKAEQPLSFITPAQYLDRLPANHVAAPCPSSWGEEGYWRVWLNERNQWIYPHLHAAQERMSELARRFNQPPGSSGRAKKAAAIPVPALKSARSKSQLDQPDALQERALKQAARELLLAQASDWPFILRSDTCAQYATQRLHDHLSRFTALYDQLTRSGVNESWLKQIESCDNLFADLQWRYWA
jgi:1,4-alpha-glucan branching enzyme